MADATATMPTIHRPVLARETLQYLNPKPDGVYVDATLGTGGHFQQIAQHLSREGFLIGLDADPAAIEFVRQNITIAIPHQLIHTNFAGLERTCYRLGQLHLDGILFDLGLSSFALDNAGRGFTYLQTGPLDMRFNPQAGQPASVWLNSAPVEELTQVFWQYGEERKASQIARAIVAQRALRRIETTAELAQIVRTIIPPATVIKSLSRIFQAIRIQVNDELETLRTALEQAVKLLRPGGRLVCIAYHSLEDRIIKQFFGREAKDCICPPEFPICGCQHKATLRVLTSKAVRPTEAEVAENPRARSARLRAAEKLGGTHG